MTTIAARFVTEVRATGASSEAGPALRSRLLATAGMMAAGVLVTSDVWRDSFGLALRDEETDYVLAAPLVVAWIVWTLWPRLRRCDGRGAVWGILVMAAGWALWSWGYRGHVFTAWHAGPVLVVAGCAVCAFGGRMLVEFLPVFGAMVFLIPLTPYRRQWIAGPMQTITAELTRRACDLLGIYVDRLGDTLSINGRDVAVAEACNGMRMVLTLFLVCYAVAFTMPLRNRVRVAILVLAPAVAVACNIVRLVPTVWMFGHTSREAAETFHAFSGWGMLAVALLLVRGSVSVLEWTGVRVRTDLAPAARARPSLVERP
jgi:exosortase